MARGAPPWRRRPDLRAQPPSQRRAGSELLLDPACLQGPAANGTAPANTTSLVATNGTAGNTTAPAAGAEDRKKQGGGWWRGKGPGSWGDWSDQGGDSAPDGTDSGGDNGDSAVDGTGEFQTLVPACAARQPANNSPWNACSSQALTAPVGDWAGSLAVYAWACLFRRAACPPPGPEVCCPATHACPLDPILPTPDGSDGSEPCARHKPDGSWDYSNCGSGGSGGAGDGSGDDSTGEAGMGRATMCSTPNLPAPIVECLPTRVAHTEMRVPMHWATHRLLPHLGDVLLMPRTPWLGPVCTPGK